MTDAVCEQFLQHARLDSSGVFTVDWKRLREVYGGVQRVLPDLYLCKLFQALVCAAPERIDFSVRGRALEIRCIGGNGFDADSLGGVQRYLEQGAALGEEPRCRHLASALLSTVTRADLSVSVQAGARLEWCATHATVHNEAQLETRIVVRKRSFLTGIPRMLADFHPRWPFWPEFNSFRRRLGYHPVPVTINGVSVPCAVPGTLACHVYLGDEARVGVDLSEAPPLTSFERDGEIVPRPDVVRARQALNLNYNFGQTNPYLVQVSYGKDVLVIVSDGLPVYRTDKWLGQVGAVMVVGRSDLPTDATTLALVEGPELEAALRQAREDAELFLFSLEGQLGEAAENHLGAALRSLRALPR